VRVLTHRCRCVELDVWDGDNDEPVIYHGHTMTTKILFRDTLTAIRKYAFIKSDFPVILSLENHCSVPQQRRMAQYLRETFGDDLLTVPVNSEVEDRLPLPEKLKRKIIVKNKKLQIKSSVEAGANRIATTSNGGSESEEEDEAAAINDDEVQRRVSEV
jgi:hypothetical protein